MGFLDRLFGTAPSREPQRAPVSDDAEAIERYRYMVRSAPPETVEQAHQEAFAKLTAEQRRQVLAGLVEAAPPGESASVAATSPDDTRALARAATRAEIRQPGTMERMLGGGGMGLGASLLTSFAMGFAGSMVANSFFAALGGFGGDAGQDDAGHDDADAADDSTAELGDDGGFDGGGDFDV